MSISIFTSTNPNQNDLFMTNAELETTPAGFTKVSMVYHVSEVDTEEESDYQTKRNGLVKFYAYTSQAGKLAHKKGGQVFRTTSKDAVTCPACMNSLELPYKSLEAEIKRIAEAKVEAKKLEEETIEIPLQFEEETPTPIPASNNNDE